MTGNGADRLPHAPRPKGAEAVEGGESRGRTFFAAYLGPSMNPTLREPEMLEVEPFDTSPPRVGDVVFFLPPGKDDPVVHRVVRVTREGIATLGDNNSTEDPALLRRGDIKGRVVAAWRGRRRREIAGGSRGRLRSRWLRWRRTPAGILSRLLHPLYDAISRRGSIAGLVPASLRPRVVVFRSRGKNLYRLLIGRHAVGRYDDRERMWRIRRPFRLLVEERMLRRPEDGKADLTIKPD